MFPRTIASFRLTRSRVPSRRLAWGAAFAVSASLALHCTSPIHLDAPVVAPEQPDTLVDPATDIAFPKTLRVPSKFTLPQFTLLGVGVRTVSFLGIKVYSVGFYADLSSPSLNISKSTPPDEKIDHIVRNAACVVRIVPTRSTSYTHLRDGFIRALSARLRLASLPPAAEQAVQAPLRQLKSMFPNTPLAKHTPMEALLTAPASGRERALVVRDMGAVENTWVAEEFVLAYFEGDGISPPLKKMVVENLGAFGK